MNLWKILLNVYKVDSSEYISLVQRGPSDDYEKIQNDGFRTLKNNQKFQSKVPVEVINRCLNAFVIKAKDLPKSRLVNLRFSYVQGMNVLIAPFLYCMGELDAFYSFYNFIVNTCPLYVQPALEGVHCGVKLLDRCLQEFDPKLYSYLIEKDIKTTIYAFPWVMTFTACLPRLESVLELWDFYFSFGFHLNIMVITAHLNLHRHAIIKSEK
jgi:cell cycle arrest protein BUB2